MKENEPCAFAFSPHPCLLFSYKHIIGFWDRLWTLTISHGFLVWHWKKKHFVQSHPSISPHPSHVAPPIKTIVLVQGVGMLQ